MEGQVPLCRRGGMKGFPVHSSLSATDKENPEKYDKGSLNGGEEIFSKY